MQNHGLWKFDFEVLPKRKKEKKWMQAHHNGKMKELVYPHPILCVASKFVCSITTKWFIGWGKNGEILSWSLQLLPRDRKNVVLYTVTT